MPIVESGRIGISDIVTEFGGLPPQGLMDYYGVDAGIPKFGTIGIMDFYGKSNNLGNHQYLLNSRYKKINNNFQSFQRTGDINGIMQTMDGGYIAYAFIANRSNPTGSNGRCINIGLDPNSTVQSGKTIFNATYLRGVSKVVAVPSNISASSGYFAWWSRSANTRAMHAAIISRIGNNSSFTTLAQSLYTINNQDANALVSAINNGNNFLISFSTINTSNIYSTFFLIRNSSLGSIRATVNITSLTGNDARLMTACSYGNDFYIFYYSFNTSEYGVIVVNSDGSSYTKHVLNIPSLPFGWQGQVMFTNVIKEGHAIFIVGGAGSPTGYGLLSVNLSTLTCSLGRTLSDVNVPVGINEGQSILYLQNRGQILTLQGLNLRYYAAETLNYLREVTLQESGGLLPYSGSIAYCNNDSILTATPGNGPNGTGFYIMRISI